MPKQSPFEEEWFKQQFQKKCSECGKPFMHTDIVWLETSGKEVCNPCHEKKQPKLNKDIYVKGIFVSPENAPATSSISHQDELDALSYVMNNKAFFHEDDGRHEASNEMIEKLEEVAFTQDDYGMAKYKHPLHHSYNYDWLEMFFEEIADGLKYVTMEMKRREVVRNYLLQAMKFNDWNMVLKAFKILEIKGTGNKKDPSK